MIIILRGTLAIRPICHLCGNFCTLFPQVSFAELKTMIIFATRQKRRK